MFFAVRDLFPKGQYLQDDTQGWDVMQTLVDTFQYMFLGTVEFSEHVSTTSQQKAGIYRAALM